MVNKATERAQNLVARLTSQNAGTLEHILQSSFSQALECLHGPLSEELDDADKGAVREALWLQQEDEVGLGKKDLNHCWNTAPLPNRYVHAFATALVSHRNRHPETLELAEYTDFTSHYPKAVMKAVIELDMRQDGEMFDNIPLNSYRDFIAEHPLAFMKALMEYDAAHEESDAIGRYSYFIDEHPEEWEDVQEMMGEQVDLSLCVDMPERH